MKTKYILPALAALVLGSGCTNLDEKLYSEIPKDDFFTNEQLLTLYSGRAFVKLQAWGSEQSLWTLNIQTGDEIAAPKNSIGDWNDPRYAELQTHKFSVSNKLIRMGWDFCFDGIAACNDVIYETESSPFEFSGKSRILAEMKVLRAFYYFCAIDGWGNVPFSTDHSDKSYPEQKDRKFMFDFIVKEITENIDELDLTPSLENYGRVTQGMANTLLAKMYLNAEEWIGTAMWAEAEKACLEVINSGKYYIEDNYKANFEVYNEGSAENIFVIPYSTIHTESDHNDFVMFILSLADYNAQRFNIPADCWDGLVAQPDFFVTYDDADTRKADTWLYGQQYDYSGKPIDGIIVDPIFSEDLYSTGKGKYDGAKVWKWTYQTDGLLTSDQTSMDNDFAIFRYADVLLMYAEAQLRQGNAGAAIANPDFQKIRTRAGLAPFTASDLTLDALLAERGHELCLEGWRRQDLIRFGKFSDPWWAKPSSSPATAKLYPIPAERRSANPNLDQNPGY